MRVVLWNARRPAEHAVRSNSRGLYALLLELLNAMQHVPVAMECMRELCRWWGFVHAGCALGGG